MGFSTTLDKREKPTALSLFVHAQRVIPQHALSRLVGAFAAAETSWIRSPLIKTFVRAYGVDLSEAERTEASDYRSFNDFFTRALRPDARHIAQDPTLLVSPADAAVKAHGLIDPRGRIPQIKGLRFSVDELVARPAPELVGGPP